MGTVLYISVQKRSYVVAKRGGAVARVCHNAARNSLLECTDFSDRALKREAHLAYSCHRGYSCSVTPDGVVALPSGVCVAFHVTVVSRSSSANIANIKQLGRGSVYCRIKAEEERRRVFDSTGRMSRADVCLLRTTSGCASGPAWR